jgi:hypothetical protein
MRRLVTALAAGLALCLPTALVAHADLVGAVTATLSCSDGHSVVVTVDQVGLTSLLSDVQAINSGASGVTCTVDTAAVDPTATSTDWTVFDYNPSGQAIAPRHSPDSGPATSPDGGTTWQFKFHSNVFTALFTSTDPNLTGNLCPMYPVGCPELNDTVTLSGDAKTFVTQGIGGDCVNNTPAAVRFYFTAPSASGSTVGTPTAGTPPAGFYTEFWWSNPVNVQLLSGNQPSMTMTVDLGDPSMWSDWNGQRASEPSVTEAFAEATQKVQSIGLSFGGECFFETGVTPSPPTDGETFASQFSETPAT